MTEDERASHDRRRLAAQGRHLSLVPAPPSTEAENDPFGVEFSFGDDSSYLSDYPAIPLDPSPSEPEDVSSLPYYHPYFETDEYLRTLLDPKRLQTTEQIGAHFEKVARSIDDMWMELSHLEHEVGEHYSLEFGGVYDFAYLVDQSEVVREQAKTAFSEVVDAHAKLKAASDRFLAIARKCQQPDICGDTAEAADWIDAKHGLAHKRLRLKVHWHGEKNGFTIQYREPDPEGADAYALHLLFTALFFEWNGERDRPCWSFDVPAPEGTIERLREGLDRLGYKYVEWDNRLDLIDYENTLLGKGWPDQFTASV